VGCDGIIVIENKQQWNGWTARKLSLTKATLGEVDRARLFVKLFCNRRTACHRADDTIAV